MASKIMYIRNVPSEVKDGFKKWCNKYRLPMTQVLIVFMSELGKDASEKDKEKVGKLNFLPSIIEAVRNKEIKVYKQKRNSKKSKYREAGMKLVQDRGGIRNVQFKP